MALTVVRFEVEGEQQLVRGFQLMEAESRDLSDPLEETGELVIDHVGRQFDSRGQGRWKPLDPAYAAWKRRHFPGQPILVRTGAMRAAALDPYAAHTTPSRMTYTVRSDVAGYHQGGGDEGNNPPRRKLVDLTAAERRGVDRIFSAWLNRLRRGAGL